jgi:hypothetical protein
MILLQTTRAPTEEQDHPQGRPTLWEPLHYYLESVNRLQAKQRSCLKFVALQVRDPATRINS